MGILVVLMFVLSIFNIVELRPTATFQNRSRLNFEFSPFGHTNETCNLAVKDTLVIDTTNTYFADGADLVVFNIKIIGYTRQDSNEDNENNNNQLQLILTNSQAGKAMLVLPGPFVQMSLCTLSHGIHELDVTLKQIPDNCLGRTNDTDTITKLKEQLRHAILTSFGSHDSKLSADIKVCHKNTIDSEFIYTCCTADLDGPEVCEQVKPTSKMNVLLTMITVLLTIVMLYSPVLIPPSLYLWNTSETYNIQLPQDENRINLETKFNIDPDVKIDFHNLEKTSRGIKIQVNHDKIVSSEGNPVGLFSFVWHFCKNSESVTACTNAPLLPFCKTTGGSQKNSCHRVCLRTLVSHCVRFLGLISPLIAIILFTELTKRKQICPLVESDVLSSYDTPALCFILGMLILATLLSLSVPEIVKKHVITVMIEDIKKSMTSGFCRFVGLVSSSFQKLGLCVAVILLPITMVLFSPILLSVFPLLRSYYLYTITSCRVGKMYKEIDKYLNLKESKLEGCFVLNILLYVTTVYVVTYACLYFYVLCIVYTIIGVVINAEFYAQYVIFFTIIILYGFNNVVKVSEVFTKFNKTLQAYTQKRFSDKLNYTRPGANSAVVIQIEDKTMEFKTDASGRLICCIPGLVLFRYSNGTQHISKRFLSQFTKDIHHQFPEKPHVLYGRAFINLVLITIFIVGVFLVVYAFGRSNGITSAGKLMIAVSGSILPILLRGVLFNVEAEEKHDTDSESWKDAFNKVLENYKEYWFVDPITFENGNENVAGTSLDNESMPLLADEIEISVD